MPSKWTEQLNVLKDLQKIDLDKFVMQRELEMIPREKEAAVNRYETEKQDLKQAEDLYKSYQMKLKERENEMATKEGAIAKYETQQMSVKTNKEYSALTHEIEVLKGDCSIFEDEILKMMDLAEAQKKKVQTERAKLAETEKKHKQELATLEAKAKDLQTKVDKLNADRKAFLPKVDRNVILIYEKILIKRSGKALSGIDGQRCMGCNVSVTPQSVNVIKLKDTMVVCESCGRILYED